MQIIGKGIVSTAIGNFLRVGYFETDWRVFDFHNTERIHRRNLKKVPACAFVRCFKIQRNFVYSCFDNVVRTSVETISRKI